MATGLTTSCSPMFCSFPYSWCSQSIRFPLQSMSTCTANSRMHLSPLGIPCTIRKLSLFEAFCRFISVFGNTGEETLHCHEVPLVTTLLAHVIVFLLKSSQQVTSMISSVDGFQEGTWNGLSVIPNSPEIQFTLEFPVFDLGLFFGLGFSLL